MKKKVRIYKAPDGNGKYVNKTSQFLAKAQMGGTPDPSMLAYPGAQPAQEQDNTNQLIQFVVNDITNQVAKEKTLFQLVNIMGVPIDAASELYVTIAEKLTEDIEKEDDRTYEQETGQPRQKEAPLTKDAIITENPEVDTDYDLFDDTGSDIVMEDSDQGPDVLDEALDPLAEQRYGGATRRRYQDGGEYDVALPSAENYEALVQPMMGYDLVSQMAWNSDEESTSPYAKKEFANTTVDYSRLQNGGAYKKAKKKYVSSVMGLLKKQMGGTNESDVDPNQGDPTGANFREGRLKLFTDTVKNDAQMFAMQNQVEQQYDQMMQEGGMLMPEQDIENPMHHLQLYSQATSGIFGEPMNQTVKARNGMIVGDDLPRGFYKRSMKRFGNIPNLREVDVRKSGLFGPKQYTMYFDPSPLQQISNPISAQMYGYGSSSTASRKQTRTFDAVKTYTNLATDAVNNESLKEVEKNTPGNNATNAEGASTPGETGAPVVGGTATNPVVTAPVIPPIPPVVIPEDPIIIPKDPLVPEPTIDFTPGLTKIKQGIEGYQAPVITKAQNASTRSAANPSGVQNLKLPGDDKNYFRDIDGKWTVDDIEKGRHYPVNDKNVLAKLNAGEGKGSQFFKLDSKPGYYYRLKADSTYAKFKGDLNKHSANSKVLAIIKPGDPGYNLLYNQGITYYPDFRQLGGTIDNPFANPMEPLQKFVGGGYDPSINDLSENQIQYMDSKDVTDAYMQGGGFIKNFIPANLTRSSQNDVVQRIYNPVTGQTYSQVPANAARQISAIDVKKRGITGRPKKYTIYYGGAGSMPPKSTTEQEGDKKRDSKADQKTTARQQSLENAGYGDRTDVTGLKGKSKRAIRQGERQRDRELEKLYKEDPTNVAFTKIDENAPFDYTQPKPKLSAQDYLTTSWGDVRGDLNSDLQTNLDEFLKTDPAPEQIDDKVAELLEQRSRDMGPDPSFFASPEQEKINQMSMQRNPMMMGFNRSPIVQDNSTVLQGNDLVQDAGENVLSQEEVEQNLETDQTMGYPIGSFQDYMSQVGPVAGEEDQLTPEEDAAARAQFAQEYMGDSTPYDPNTALVTPGMIDYNFIQDPEAAYNARLQELNPMTDMGAWSGMSGPADILEPGVNPFELPVGGGEEYYPPFAQPIAAPVVPSAKPKQNKTQTLDEWRASERRRSNYGKTYTYNPNMRGVEKDPDYRRVMQEARKDGIVTNEEANNATRIFKQKQAQQEKDRIASQAQRTINQIMNSSASTAEKNKAREKVILQMEQRWDVVDRAANSRKYGGALSKFVGGGNNQPFTGENPVAYTNNPAIEGAQGQINWNQMSSPSLVTQMNTDGTKSYGVDATYQGLQPFDDREKMEKMPILPASAGLKGFAKGTEQLAGTNTPLAIDVKNKLSQGEREARLIAGNSLMRGVAGFKNRRDDTKQMEGFYDNLTADNLYASDPSRDRGDYAESGLYRPDEQGQTWYGRSAQMGGYVDDDFEDGEEVYMTDEEIKEYMANGGQIEFI
jgi:hypothetical protein